MNLEEFRAKYVTVRAKEHISINCEQCGGVRYPGKSKAQENIVKNGKYICQTCATSNSIPNRVYTDEGRKRIATATSYKRSASVKDKMRQSANAKWETPEGRSLKKHLARITTERQARNEFEPTRRRGMYLSKKMGHAIPFSSSYELKAFLLLEDDDSVITYKPQVAFDLRGRHRCLDILIDNRRAIEVYLCSVFR
jgi:hypothetical protein